MGAPTALGLSDVEAGLRRAQVGPNAVHGKGEPAVWTAIREVLREPMLVLLLATVGVYVALGEPREAIALVISVVVVVGLTLYQSVRAERALDALRTLNAPMAHVLRGGQWMRIAAMEVVPGDVCEVAEGERVPADARLLEGQALEIDEALLTGESFPVTKAADGEGEAAMIFAGTFVVRGRGRAEVLYTGAASRIGGIGSALDRQRRQPGPLQRQVRRLIVAFAMLGCVVSVVLAGLLLAQGTGHLRALLGALTLAIATIPEEFPVVLSVFFAIGAWRISRERALIRRPGAIETLGSVDVLCTDKTGTLTRNSMEVRQVHVACTGQTEKFGPELAPDALVVLQAAARACARPTYEPMEQALLVAGGDQISVPLLRHYPFSKNVPMVANVYDGDVRYVACKGAPEQIIAQCFDVESARTAATEALRRLSAAGLRVIGVGEANLEPDALLPEQASDFVLRWLGLVAFEDPLRPEVPEAVRAAQTAGIRVVLITGDHPLTATAIASQAGILHSGAAMTAGELHDLDDSELALRVESTGVLARILPEDKLRIVRALSHRGHVVAMTGDGVNDAPALAAAHVGIAMGIKGTDVAKEAASVVLADDNFATIVRAVAMGRRIHDNVRAAVAYIVAVHIPIAGAALVPVLLGGPMLLLPVHVLLLELLIDPASSLMFERLPGATDVMRRPPRAPREPLFTARAAVRAGVLGLASLAAVITVYLMGVKQGENPGAAATLALVSIVTGNLVILAASGPFHATREARRSFMLLVGVVVLVLTALIAMPMASSALGLARPSPTRVAFAIGIAIGTVGAAALVSSRMGAKHWKLTKVKNSVESRV